MRIRRMFRRSPYFSILYALFLNSDPTTHGGSTTRKNEKGPVRKLGVVVHEIATPCLKKK